MFKVSKGSLKCNYCTFDQNFGYEGIKKLKEKYDRVRQIKDESDMNKKYLKEREVDTVIDNR